MRPTINLSEPEINTHVRFISDKNMPFESLPRAPFLMICPSVSSSPRWLLRHHLIYALRTDQSVQVSQFNTWTSDFGLTSSFNWLHISDCLLCKIEFSQFRSGERRGDPFLCVSVQSTPTKIAFSPSPPLPIQPGPSLLLLLHVNIATTAAVAAFLPPQASLDTPTHLPPPWLCY